MIGCVLQGLPAGPQAVLQGFPTGPQAVLQGLPAGPQAVLKGISAGPQTVHLVPVHDAPQVLPCAVERVGHLTGVIETLLEWVLPLERVETLVIG